jgi:hypothetical protein
VIDQRFYEGTSQRRSNWSSPLVACSPWVEKSGLLSVNGRFTTSKQTNHVLSRRSTKRRRDRSGSNAIAPFRDSDEQSCKGIASNRPDNIPVAPYPPKEVLQPHSLVIFYMSTVESIDYDRASEAACWRGVGIGIPLHSLATSSTRTRSELSISSVMVSVFVMSTGGRPPGITD